MSKDIPLDQRKPPVVVRKKARQVLPAPQPEKYTSGPPAEKKGTMAPESPVALLLATLSGRVKVGDDYFLDGKRSSFYQCIREANRVRKARGEKQIIGSPEWLV